MEGTGPCRPALLVGDGADVAILARLQFELDGRLMCLLDLCVRVSPSALELRPEASNRLLIVLSNDCMVSAS